MRYQSILVIPVLILASNAVTITDLFFTKAIGPGSCASPRNTVVESWLQDTVTLVGTTLNALSGNIGGDKPLKRNLYAWFGIDWKATGLSQLDDDKLQRVTRKLPMHFRDEEFKTPTRAMSFIGRILLRIFTRTSKSSSRFLGGKGSRIERTSTKRLRR
jgi:hypothetical protein